MIAEAKHTAEDCDTESALIVTERFVKNMTPTLPGPLKTEAREVIG